MVLEGSRKIQEGKLLIATGSLIIAATIGEDILTGGIGITDDSITIAAGTAAIRSGKLIKSIGEFICAEGVVSGNSPSASNRDATDVKSVFASLGSSGDSDKKLVSSLAELKETFNKLAEGGTIDTSMKNYNGIMMKLQDGTKIGYREKSSYKSDGLPTIDIFYKDNKHNYKVHIDVNQ